MQVRSTQGSVFRQVQSGIQLNLWRLGNLQEQVSSGKRIQRPSDDPAGTAQAISLRRQRGSIDSFLSALQISRPVLSSASTQLQEASTSLAEARSLIVQGMNGTLGAADRETVAEQIELAAKNVLEIANSRWGDRFLFAGTDTGSPPFRVETVNGVERVVYDGNGATQNVSIGRNAELEINVPGSDIFAKFEFTGVQYTGTTGVKSGTSADSGSGYADLALRHDLTSGALGVGLAFNQTGDTILGDHALVVDGVAGTMTLGGGPAVAIPSPLPADFVLTDEDGSELHLDLTGYTGGDLVTTVTGDGSISLDGTTFSPIDFAATDFELIDSATGAVLHVDLTEVSRAGDELVTFAGAANVFDTLMGAVHDLRSSEDLPAGNLLDRLNHRLTELDRNFDNLQIGNGQLGVRIERLDVAEDRLAETDVQLASLQSTIEDTDLAEAVLQMTRAEQTLQVAQATGARLIQQSLLNYLR